MCTTTTGVGVLDARIKGLLLDEVFGAPFSMSVGLGIRWGELTAATRSRITNLGEGSLDLGPFVSVGRTGRLGGSGIWSGWIEVTGRGRFPLTDDYPDPSGGVISAPGSELLAAAELLMGSHRLSLGPTFTTLWRPFGLDWGELDLTNPDRFGALNAANVRVGATVVLRGEGRTSAAGWILATPYASNNPSDVLTVGFGVQFAGPLRRAEPLR